MSDIRNIRSGSVTPDRIFRVIDNQPEEIRRIYKVVNSQPVIVWDIGGTVKGLVMKFDIALSGNIIVIDALETTSHTGKIDWGDGTVQDYTSTLQTGHMYSETSGTSYTVTIDCQFENLLKVHINRGVLTEIIIPDGVVSLDERCLSGQYSLIKATLPDSIVSMGSSCFYVCEALTEIKLPPVSVIPANCFYCCTALQSVEIPDTVTEIKQNAFYKCSALQEITIPDSVTKINYSAFQNCTGLTEIYVSNSLSQLYLSAFASCTSLQSITLPVSLTYMESDIFQNCTALQTVYYEGSQEQFDQISKWSEDGWLGNCSARLVCLG